MLIDLVELACNEALKHDDATAEGLEKLQGKSMALHIKNIAQSLTLTPSPEGVELSNEIKDDVDVKLTTTLGAILKISRDGMENAELKPGELEISGDPIVGQRFASLITELNINWQSLLAEHLGDSPAHTITLFAKHARKFVEQSKSQLDEQFSQIVGNELALSIDTKTVDNFLNDVDILRAYTERLNARLKRLQQI